MGFLQFTELIDKEAHWFLCVSVSVRLWANGGQFLHGLTHTRQQYDFTCTEKMNKSILSNKKHHNGFELTQAGNILLAASKQFYLQTAWWVKSIGKSKSRRIGAFEASGLNKGVVKRKDSSLSQPLLHFFILLYKIVENTE